MSDLVQRLRAAHRDERLANGPLYGEAADRIEALESEWDRLADSLRHAGVEPWHDGRSLLDGKRPREQHIAMIVAAERAAREAAEAQVLALRALFGNHDALDHDTDAEARRCDICRALADTASIALLLDGVVAG